MSEMLKSSVINSEVSVARRVHHIDSQVHSGDHDDKDHLRPH